MNYQFEWNDIRAILNFLNVILLIIFGRSFAYISLLIAFIGLIKDATIDKKFNGVILHFSSILITLMLI